MVHAKRTIIEFSELRLSGEVVRPSDAFILVPKRSRFRSLIRLRGDFAPELLRSVERL